MNHGILDWTKRQNGKRAIRCECGWESASMWRTTTNQSEQVESLRLHVRSTWQKG